MNSCKDSCTKSIQKKKFVREVSEIRARILKNEEIHAQQVLNKERNLYTNSNKSTRLH